MAIRDWLETYAPILIGLGIALAAFEVSKILVLKIIV